MDRNRLREEEGDQIYSHAISYRASVSPDGVWTMKSDTGKGVLSSGFGQNRI